MFQSTRAVGVMGSALVLAGVYACGGSTPSFNGSDGGATQPTGATTDGGGTEGPSGEGPSLGGDDGGSGPRPDPNGTCAATETAAVRARVDIILAIDTSGSMDQETEQVRQNINNFAQSIGNSGLDYQVILVAAKKGANPFPFPLPFPIPDLGMCIPPPLGGANCGDNPPLFHHVATTVNSNDGLDVLLSSYDAAWKAWARPDAYKVFIMITDDDADLAHATFDQRLLAKAPAGMFGDATKRKYIFNSICGWQDGTPVLSATKCSTAVNIGTQHQELSKLTGGMVDSVCKTSYAGVFDNLAKGLVSKLGCEFAMPKPDGGVTDPGKVVVQYTPGSGPNQGTASPLTQVTDPSKCGTISGAWYYDNNASPTKIVFCPSTCASAGNDTSGKIAILLGCQGAPPR